MCDSPYLVTHTFMWAVPALSSMGEEFSCSFFFLVFLTTGKEILFKAESGASSKNSKAQFPTESA